MEPIAYLRDPDGEGSYHPCAEGDPGAIAVYADDDVATLERRLGHWKARCAERSLQIRVAVQLIDDAPSEAEIHGSGLKTWADRNRPTPEAE